MPRLGPKRVGVAYILAPVAPPVRLARTPEFVKLPDPAGYAGRSRRRGATLAQLAAPADWFLVGHGDGYQRKRHYL